MLVSYRLKTFREVTSRRQRIIVGYPLRVQLIFIMIIIKTTIIIMR
jgi:hypothetical protein